MFDMTHSHVRHDSNEGRAEMSWSLAFNTHIRGYECAMTRSHMHESIYVCMHSPLHLIHTYIRMSVTWPVHIQMSICVT